MKNMKDSFNSRFFEINQKAIDTGRQIVLELRALILCTRLNLDSTKLRDMS